MLLKTSVSRSRFVAVAGAGQLLVQAAFVDARGGLGEGGDGGESLCG